MKTEFTWIDMSDSIPEEFDELFYACAIHEEDGKVEIDQMRIVHGFRDDTYRSEDGNYTPMDNPWWSHWCYHRDVTIEI